MIHETLLTTLRDAVTRSGGDVHDLMAAQRGPDLQESWAQGGKHLGTCVVRGLLRPGRYDEYNEAVAYARRVGWKALLKEIDALRPEEINNTVAEAWMHWRDHLKWAFAAVGEEALPMYPQTPVAEDKGGEEGEQP